MYEKLIYPHRRFICNNFQLAVIIHAKFIIEYTNRQINTTANSANVLQIGRGIVTCRVSHISFE